MPTPQNVVIPPVPTRQPMLDTGGLASRPWIAWFTTLVRGIFNQFVQVAGVELPQELAINFLPPFTVTDNPADGSTDIGISVTPVTPPVQTVVAVAFATAYQNTGTTPRVMFLTIDTPGGTSGTATVYSDATATPTLLIGQTSVVATGGGSVSTSIAFEVMPGNYFHVEQDTGSLSILLAVQVQ